MLDAAPIEDECWVYPAVSFGGLGADDALLYEFGYSRWYVDRLMLPWIRAE
ncbi:MAG: hypothetical protein LBC63_06155 [Holophagales bacterium]|nr:hypothetical protein [Holophagales bacterium]